MGGYGSASAGRVGELTAGKLTSKLSDGIADGRGRQYTTPNRRWHISGRAAGPLRKRSFGIQPEICTPKDCGHSRARAARPAQARGMNDCR